MVYLSQEEIFDDLKRNIANTILDIRTYGLNKLLKRVYERGNIEQDYNNLTDVTTFIENMYSAEEVEHFKEVHAPYIDCCIYAYNFSSSLGSGRTLSTDRKDYLLKKQEIYKEIYKSQQIHILYNFRVYIENDLIHNLLKLNHNTDLTK